MNRRSIPLLVVVAWLALQTFACSKVTDAPELGTNTNWLKTCREQSECGERKSCVCGVCTRACSEDAQCAAVHAETSCLPLSAAACESGQETPAAACLQGCRADDDCSALENGRCLDGLCVPPARLGTEPASGPGASTSGRDPEASEIDGGPAPAGADAGAEFVLERVDTKVLITSAYTECERDLECTVVSTSCNGCCDVGAINIGYKYIYDPEHERACWGYRGAECDCDVPDLVARCEAGRCRTAPRDTATCFSPVQNPQRAFEEGALGCRCRRLDAFVCTAGAHLRCMNEGSQLMAWRLSERCAPVQATCDGWGQQRASVEACSAEFSQCNELADGTYCGVF